MMDGFKLWINELKFLFRSSLVKLLIIITAIFQVIGLNALDNSNSISLQAIRKTSYTMALGSAKYGAVAGALLFALLTLYILDKDNRKKSKDLIGTSQNYFYVIVARIISLVIFATMAVLLGGIAVWIIHKLVLHIDYNMSTYLMSYGVVTLPSIIFSILICSSFYLQCYSP